MKSGTLHTYTKNLAFENEFANYIGLPHCLSVCSASMGLFAAFKSLGIQDGEVIIPTMNWPGALWFFDLLNLTPVLTDISLESYTICPEKVQQSITADTKAILAVDMFGYPADWYRLRAVADAHGLPLIGDCAQSFGSFYDEYPSGHFADVAVFSFGVGKVFSIGEGGMIVCRKREDFEKVVANFGHPDVQRIHLGTIKNYFTPNIRLNPVTAHYAAKSLKPAFDGIISQSAFIHSEILHKSLEGDVPNYARMILPPTAKNLTIRNKQPQAIPEDYLLVNTNETAFPNTTELYNNFRILTI